MSNVHCKDLFLSSLTVLQPHHLLDRVLQLDPNTRQLSVDSEKYNLNGSCYLIGAGKAVLGLAAQVVHIIGNIINGGIISVPSGISAMGENNKLLAACDNGRVRVMEGAKNNLPDVDSMNTTIAIVDLVKNLSENDLVIVLLSGGGSALLPLPVSGISLEKKLEVVKLLGRAGADITELNTVRKALSAVKGGNLAELICPAKVITLILSDIIGDPLDFIASGPTVPNTDHPAEPLKIIQKFGLQDQIAREVLSVLETNSSKKMDKQFSHVQNIILGNNKLVLDHVDRQLRQEGHLSCILSSQISGNARQMGINLAEMTKDIILQKSNETMCHWLQLVKSEDIAAVLKVINRFNDKESDILVVIGGGETTVNVVGEGKGGRNQELVLAFALNLDQEILTGYNVEMLSCGTDGIDGPTDAAGAVWNSHDDVMVDKGREHLARNDSYNYWTQMGGLVMTGHTGTNVMDVQILIIRRKENY